MNIKELIGASGWVFRDNDLIIESPSFNSPEEMQKVCERFISALQTIGKGERAIRAVERSLRHDQLHAAADERLSENGAVLRFHSGKGMQYYPLGTRTPRQEAVIACGPGRQRMSKHDFKALKLSLEEMGFDPDSIRDKPLANEIRSVYSESQSRVDWWNKNKV